MLYIGFLIILDGHNIKKMICKIFLFFYFRRHISSKFKVSL